METCPAGFTFITSPCGSDDVDANIERKSFLQTFNFHCPALASRPADFPYGCEVHVELLTFGSDVLISLLLQACRSNHLVPSGSLEPASQVPAMLHPCGLPILSCCGLPPICKILADDAPFESGSPVNALTSRFTFVPGPLGFHKTSSHSSPLFNGASFDSGAEESAFKGFSSSPGFFKPVSELPPGC